MSIALNFEHRFASLPPVFYTQMKPEGVGVAPRLIHVNAEIATSIGLDPESFGSENDLQIFCGNCLATGSQPLAMVYSGHQFGVWAGQLGDGRALLLGQVRNAKGELWDIQLKGSGLTPYSRMGDGRAVLRSCIREYLASEAMAGLGIPTTRALCVIATGADVYRERKEPGAVLTRVTRSHVRFGHFEHFYALGDHESLRILAEYVRTESYPDCATHSEWFRTLVYRTADLIAQWQAFGFCHGVMNTDNMSIIGETIDYGPFGFLDEFDPGHICNHSDDMGRYACNRQPEIALWNLQALAWALQPLIPLQESGAHLKEFSSRLHARYYEIMRQKFGFLPEHADNDELWEPLLTEMASQKVDYSLSFRGLADLIDSKNLETDQNSSQKAKWLALFAMPDKIQPLMSIWRKGLLDMETNSRRMRAPEEIATDMRQVSPKYILRNWVAESVIRDVEDRGDLESLKAVMTVLRRPFEEHSEFEAYAAPPPHDYASLTVSCSS